MHLGPHAVAAVVLILGLCQWFYTLRFYLSLRREFRSQPEPYFPPVSVLVACSGQAEGFRENIRSLVSQNYRGEVEHLFIVPDATDPAHAALEKIAQDCPDRRIRVLVSGAIPNRASEKALNLLYGLDRISKDSEVLAFTDSDLRLPTTWLKDLVAPLKDPAIGIATSAMLYAPTGWGLWGLLRMAWVTWGIPYLQQLGCVTGQAFALRRSLAATLGLKELWGRSLSVDLPLARQAYLRGVPVRFVGRAMPVSAEACDARRFFSMVNRWIICFRVYMKPIWYRGAAVTLAKTLVLAWALKPPVSWSLIALLFFLDAANLYALLRLFERRMSERFSMRGTALVACVCAPLLQLAYLVNFLNSLLSREVRWGNYRYRIRGERVEAFPATSP